eukprot:PhM_4_TR839/c0_g2_i1/m.59538/K16073/ALR, MNR; magnesium transporter
MSHSIDMSCASGEQHDRASDDVRSQCTNTPSQSPTTTTPEVPQQQQQERRGTVQPSEVRLTIDTAGTDDTLPSPHGVSPRNGSISSHPIVTLATPSAPMGMLETPRLRRVVTPTTTALYQATSSQPSNAVLPDIKSHMWLLTRSSHSMRQRTFHNVEEVVKVASDVFHAASGPSSTASGPSTPMECVGNASFSGIIEDPDAPGPVLHLHGPALGQHESTWIDLKGASDDEITAVGHALRLSPLTIEDLTTSDAPEKLELVGPYFLSIMCYNDGNNVMEKISIVLGPNFVLSVHTGSTWVVAEALTRLDAMRLITLTSEHVFYSVFDTIVDSVAASVLRVQDEVDFIDEIVLVISERERTDVLRRISAARRKVGALRASATIKESILRTVLHATFAKNFLLRQNYVDVLDHVNQSLGRLETARDVISQANNNFTSLLSMKNAEHANAANDVMKRLTIMSGIMMPLNLVTSAFGMNVRVPWQTDDYPTLNAFYGITASAVLFVITTLCVIWYTRRQRALRKIRDEREHMG